MGKRSVIQCKLLLLVTFFSIRANSQDSLKWMLLFNDSSFQLPSVNNHPGKIKADSLALVKLKSIFVLPDANIKNELFKVQKKNLPEVKGRPFIRISGGYINYQWNYRSNIDTPFLESNISQHLIASSLDLTAAGVVPLRVTLFQRFSNSDIFRDFTDFRIEFNNYAFQQMQLSKLREYFNGISSQVRDPMALSGMDISKERFSKLGDWLNMHEIRTKYINARESILFPELLETGEIEADRDSLLQQAKDFVAFYEKLERTRKRYEYLYDSLQQVYELTESKLRNIQKLLKGNINNPENKSALISALRASGINEEQIRKLNSPLNGIRTLAIGRTQPNFSSLTVKNINVRGLNLEYNQDNLYLAVIAGAVDFRIRDFVYSNQKRVPQYVTAARVGYGTREGRHMFITFYGGQKQLYPSLTQSKAYPVFGFSAEGQYMLGINHRLTAEFAQSNTNGVFSGQQGKPEEQFWNKNNRAYAFSLRSFFPQTRTRLEAMYQHQGINFQSFTNFRTNADFDSWNIRADQSFLSRQLMIRASIQKNDFANPFILQRYNTNTIFKTLSATFRKKHWPAITLAYTPSSQYSIIDSMVYENRFQVMNGTLNHQFKLGSANTTLVFMVNKFYNDNRDTGFIYYNASNIYFNQVIQFTVMSLNWGVSYMNNGIYGYTIMEAGTGFTLWKKSLLQGGFKINKIDNESSKVGFYANTRVSINKLGDLNLLLEKNYLPGINYNLVENTMYSIGFTRYFQNKN